MEAVAKINEGLYEIRKELEAYDAVKKFPKPFSVNDVPAEVDAMIDQAVAAVNAKDFEKLNEVCQKIEAYFGFAAPNLLVS